MYKMTGSQIPKRQSDSYCTDIFFLQMTMLQIPFRYRKLEESDVLDQEKHAW